MNAAELSTIIERIGPKEVSEEEMQEAIDLVKNAQNVAQELQLTFYGLYKQFTVGAVNIPKPGMFDLVGKKKWDAWKSYERFSKSNAALAYCYMAYKLANKPFPAPTNIVLPTEDNSFRRNETSDPHTFKFKVEGMMCQKNCASTVRKAIESVPGVSAAEVSYPRAEALVWGEKATPEDIIASIEDVGYGAEIDVPTYKFTIEGMMCQKNCARTVREAIMSVDGVEAADVSYPRAEAEVWSSTASADAIISAVEDVGYGAELSTGKTIMPDNIATTVTGAELWEVPTAGSAAPLSNNVISQSGKESSRMGTGGGFDQLPDICLSVKGMFDVVACAQKIRETLLAVDGVSSVHTDFDKKLCFVWGFADPVAAIESLAAEGYLASEIDFANQRESRNGSSSTTISPLLSSNVLFLSLRELKKITSNIDTVKTSLKKIDGVQCLDVDVKAGIIAIHFSSAMPLNKLKDALVQLRYSVAIIDAHSVGGGGMTASTVGVASSGRGGGTGGNGPIAPGLSKRRELVFNVTGMSCANCAMRIEKALSSIPGVSSPSVSSMTNKAKAYVDETATGAAGPRDISDKIQAMGYGCQLAQKEKVKVGKDGEVELSCQLELVEWKRMLIIAVLFGVPIVALHLLMMASLSFRQVSMEHSVCDGAVPLGQVLMFLLNLPILVIVGFRFYRAALLGARHGNFGMDFLVMTGTSVAFGYSSVQLAMACSSGIPTPHMFFETVGMLLMFVTMGKFIEAYAKGRSCSAIANLLKLQPQEALLVLQTDGCNGSNGKSSTAVRAAPAGAGASDGSTKEITKTISLELVQRGDLLKVYPGDRIPTDGNVERGNSYVDESMITGESVPLLKGKGDLVFGSTVNQDSVLYVRVTSLGSESALAQIVALVENAQMNKAPVQAYADRVAGVFTPVILALASLTFIVWCSLSVTHVVPASWFEEEYNDPYLFSMLFAISVVVISCPCALGLATPTAIMVGTSVGAGQGILIKGGTAFETAHKIDTVVFDKTGTLTVGKPHVTDEVVFGDVSGTGVTKAGARAGSGTAGMSVSGLTVSAEQRSKDALLQLVASAEQCSDHPIARALRDAAEDRGIALHSLDTSAHPENAVYSVGSGISVVLEQGTVLVGNRAFMEEHGISVTAELDTAMWDIEIQGKTAICAALDREVVGVLGVADVAKEEALSTIRALHAMNIDVWMITGDNRTTAEALASQLDIPKERVLAGVLPKDKVLKVEELQHTEGRSVAMVGDGINDSPALAEAHLGVAIGAGTEVAIEAADMVLVRSHLHDLVVALDLAKVVFARIKWNFVWALCYNLLAVPYAAGVWFPWTHVLLPPQYAGLAMALSSVSVVLSSMALWLYKRPKDLMKAQSVRKALAGGSVIDKAAASRLMVIKENIVDRMTGSAGPASGGSGSRYSYLPSRDSIGDDLETGQSMGLGIEFKAL